MDLKKVLRFGVILSIFVIIGYFYYSFFYKNKNIISKSNDVLVTNNSNHADEIVSELQNIEYNSTDKNGNTYYLNAERAFINLEDKKDDKINLEKVVAIINIKKKGVINIISTKAYYNKINHDTLFYDGVKVEYLNNSIVSGNFDLLFTENISQIYNNVIFNSKNADLYTDNVFIDMLSGDIKLKMNEKSKYITLTTNNEFIN